MDEDVEEVVVIVVTVIVVVVDTVVVVVVVEVIEVVVSGCTILQKTGRVAVQSESFHTGMVSTFRRTVAIHDAPFDGMFGSW